MHPHPRMFWPTASSPCNGSANDVAAHTHMHHSCSTSRAATGAHNHNVQWSEDVIKAGPFFGRSRVRFRVPPWVSNAIARDHLA